MLEREGPGWRFAKDFSKTPFCVLIGGEGWAFELREKEWEVLCRLVQELTEHHHQLIDQLMNEESISIEKEISPWWGCLDGDKSTWCLQIILEGKGAFARGVEGYWPAPAAQEIASIMRTTWDSH